MHRSLLRPALMRSLPRDLSVPITDLTVHLARSHGSVRGTTAGQELLMMRHTEIESHLYPELRKESNQEACYKSCALNVSPWRRSPVS